MVRISGLTASPQAIFEQATARWEQIITGDIPIATAAYNAMFGTNATSVHIEGLPSGVGSRDSHWRESVFGNELMSPFISGSNNPISRVTVASLADLGYTVNMNAADI